MPPALPRQRPQIRIWRDDFDQPTEVCKERWNGWLEIDQYIRPVGIRMGLTQVHRRPFTHRIRRGRHSMRNERQ